MKLEKANCSSDVEIHVDNRVYKSCVNIKSLFWMVTLAIRYSSLFIPDLQMVSEIF